MFKIFESKLYLKEYENYPDDDISANDNKKEQQSLNKEDTNDKIIIDRIEPFLNEVDNIDTPNQFKKKKIKKMKNYNIRKGDWQCKYCFNINFHFRIVCNICQKGKV